MFSKILVPVDFSSCSKNALKLAIDFAAKNRTQLIILNVYSVTGTQSLSESAVKDNLIKNIKAYENEIPELSAIGYEFNVEFGLAADVIIEKSTNFDLIIMGTRGEHDVIDKLIGSVSLRVIEHSNTPVLVIPEELHAISFDKIVFAADFKKIEYMSNLDSLRELALAYDSELHLLNVNESPEYITEEEGDEALELHRFFEDVNHAFFLSESKDIEKGILDYIDKKRIDILALMPRKHAFLQSLFDHSTTDDIAMHLKSALLTFHE
ncbi:MAG: universal stress protein [Bacteroidota bacterium]